MLHRTLLLIDDDKLWVSIAVKFLQYHKFNVITAPDCASGIRAVQEHRPDCVILDFNLPDMEGCHAAFAIRGDVKVRKTPIILSTNDDTREEDAYRNYKVDGFYYKMWPLERLRGLIELILRRVDMERGHLRRGDLRLDGDRLRVFHNAGPLSDLSQEQFRLLSLLVARAPQHVTENDLICHVFGEDTAEDKVDALKMLAYRLRKSLGETLGARIKCERNRGWVYLLPEDA